MKKRILAMMLASAMVVGLVGCGGSSDSKDTKEETNTNTENTDTDTENTKPATKKAKPVAKSKTAPVNQEEPAVKPAVNSTAQRRIKPKI